MQGVGKSCGLKAIAQQVNVSVSLVSKVLSGTMGNTRVSPATVKAIKAAAQRLHYRKNHAAAALVAGRQNVIAGFIHNIGVEGSGIAEQLVRGMAAGAAQHGRRLMLRFFETTEEFINYVPEISPSLIDGLIVAGLRHRELTPRLRAIQEGGVPLVTIHEETEGEGFPNVFANQVTMGEVATEHLISQGCRRIAHLMVKESRAEGYRRALRRHALPDDPSRVYHARSFGHGEGAEAVRQLLAQGTVFDGLVAQSDAQAIGAMNALLMAGKRIPSDIKIVGVDNSPLCLTAMVPLSSVSGEFFAQGVSAVDQLVSQIEGQPGHTVEIAPVLHARESSQCNRMTHRL